MRLSSLQPHFAAVRFGSQPLGFNNWMIDYHAPGRIDLVIQAPESVEQMDKDEFTSWAQSMAIYFIEQCHSRDRRELGGPSQITQELPLFRLDRADVTRIRRYLKKKDSDSQKGHFEVELIHPEPSMGAKASTPFMVFPLYTGLRKRAFRWLFNTKNRLLEKRYHLTHRPAKSNDPDTVADPVKAVVIPKTKWSPRRRKRVNDIDQKLETIRSRTNDLMQVSPQGQICLTVPCTHGNAMIQFKKPPKKRRP